MWSVGVSQHCVANAEEGGVYYEEGMIHTISIVTSLLIFSLQLTRQAIERSAELRAEFAARIGSYDANQLVFVDESAVDRRTTYRGRAWALRGKPATRKAFFCRGQRQVFSLFA
jgi:hypothetical protein